MKTQCSVKVVDQRKDFLHLDTHSAEKFGSRCSQTPNHSKSIHAIVTTKKLIIVYCRYAFVLIPIYGPLLFFSFHKDLQPSTFVFHFYTLQTLTTSNQARIPHYCVPQHPTKLDFHVTVCSREIQHTHSR